MYYIFILFFTLSVQDIQVSFSVFQRILMIFFMYSFLYTFLMKLTPKCIIFVFINWIYFLLFSNYLLLLECYAIEFKIFIFYFSILLRSLINPVFFFFFLALLCSLWDLSSLNRDWTQALGSVSARSQPLDYQGISVLIIFQLRLLDFFFR